MVASFTPHLMVAGLYPSPHWAVLSELELGDLIRQLPLYEGRAHQPATAWQHHRHPHA